MKRAARSRGLPVYLLALVLTGCTTNHYRKSADRETYHAIKEKTPLVRNMDPHFTLEQTNAVALDGLPIATNVQEFLGPDGERERDAHVVNLENALALAVKHSRTYQSRKEQLYLSALSLTLARHQFAPIFSAGGRANYYVSTAQVRELIPDPTDPTGQRLIPIFNDSFTETRAVRASGQTLGTMLLRSGARLSAAFTTDFLRYLTGDPRTTTSSQLLGTAIQPLWRGAGFKVTMENLTQSERNLLYALRTFTFSRKRFSVDIASSYYGVLQGRDVVHNAYLNLQSSRKNAERTRALAQEGRVTQSDLGRLAQQELSTESAWNNASRSYRQALDNFKVQLGLSTDANIVLDDRELEQLRIIHPDISVEEASRVALVTRLDYQNSQDQHADAVRKVDVAANALRAQVDLVASAGIDSPQERSARFAVPDIDRYHWNAGFNLDLPLERKAERNAYRTALITREASRREVEQQEDEIKLQVRDSWRTLDQAKRNYEISEISVKLAERRVEEQDLLAELGRAKALDQVDAQNALIDSKNQRTQALVSHTIARLQFWNNMGILYIKDNGQWEEVQDAKIR